MLILAYLLIIQHPMFVFINRLDFLLKSAISGAETYINEPIKGQKQVTTLQRYIRKARYNREALPTVIFFGIFFVLLLKL